MKNILSNPKNKDLFLNKLGLNNEILMENAARSIADFLKKKFKKAKILLICGKGDNGADLAVLARILSADYEIYIFCPFEINEYAKKQISIAIKFGAKIKKDLNKIKFDCIIDGLFGIGLTRNLDENSNNIIKKLNSAKAFKISCDVPSGLGLNGEIYGEIFKPDLCITMGALKPAFYSENCPKFKIKIANLGISEKIYNPKQNLFVLQKSDLKLPIRNKENLHKYNFGHCAILQGKFSGASELAGLSALSFGAGLVSIIGQKELKNISLMLRDNLDEKINSLAIGIGFDGTENLNLQNLENKKLVLDGGIFKMPQCLELLGKNAVLTPHLGEFCELLRLCKIADINSDELIKNKIHFVKKFTNLYPCTLLLKSSISLIAQRDKIYFMPLGNVSLAKAGSGDVLAGAVLSLLAQGKKPFKAAINASLAHGLASRKIKNNYALNPEKLIKEIQCL